MDGGVGIVVMSGALRFNGKDYRWMLIPNKPPKGT